MTNPARTIVQKYGGTSVGSVERIHAVAERVRALRLAGHRVVVVLSAMSGETNRLEELGRISLEGQKVMLGALDEAQREFEASFGTDAH